MMSAFIAKIPHYAARRPLVPPHSFAHYGDRGLFVVGAR